MTLDDNLSPPGAKLANDLRRVSDAFSYIRIVTGSDAGVPVISYQVREGVRAVRIWAP